MKKNFTKIKRQKERRTISPSSRRLSPFLFTSFRKLVFKSQSKRNQNKANPREYKQTIVFLNTKNEHTKRRHFYFQSVKLDSSYRHLISHTACCWHVLYTSLRNSFTTLLFSSGVQNSGACISS